MLTFDEIMKSMEDSMKSTISIYEEEMVGMSAGRVTPSLLSSVIIKAYGTSMNISSLASVSVHDTRALSVQVWDSANTESVAKGIVDANIGLTPIVEGNVIRINVPPLNEGRRLELVKAAKKCAERCRVSLRNIRRHAVDDIKKHEKSMNMSEDEKHRSIDEIQKVTDDFVSTVDIILEKKEKSIMEI